MSSSRSSSPLSELSRTPSPPPNFADILTLAPTPAPAASSLPPKRGRGRPRKDAPVSAPAPVEVIVAPVPAAPPKRGRGRPKKVITAAVAVAVVAALAPVAALVSVAAVGPGPRRSGRTSRSTPRVAEQAPATVRKRKRGSDDLVLAAPDPLAKRTKSAKKKPVSKNRVTTVEDDIADEDITTYNKGKTSDPEAPARAGEGYASQYDDSGVSVLRESPVDTRGINAEPEASAFTNWSPYGPNRALLDPIARTIVPITPPPIVEPAGTQTFYLAYATDMDAARFMKIYPESILVGAGKLLDYQFAISAAEGQAFAIPAKDNNVFGVIYSLSASDVTTLDEHTLSSNLYKKEKEKVSIIAAGRNGWGRGRVDNPYRLAVDKVFTAMLYVPVNEDMEMGGAIDKNLIPLINQGILEAMSEGMPWDYLNELRKYVPRPKTPWDMTAEEEPMAVLTKAGKLKANSTLKIGQKENKRRRRGRK